MSYYQKKSLHSKSLFPAELFYPPITKSSFPEDFFQKKSLSRQVRRKQNCLVSNCGVGAQEVALILSQLCQSGTHSQLNTIGVLQSTPQFLHLFQINSPKLCSLFRFSIILPCCCYWYSVFTSRPSATFASNKVNRQCPDPFLHTVLHQQYLKHKRCLFQMHKHLLHLHKHLPVHPYALGHTFRFPFFQCL